MSDPVGIAAAIDVGSNSVHLLVTGPGGEVLRDESVLLGLGAMVDMEGFVPDEGIEALIEALDAYVDAAEDEGAGAITLLATEPLRRASNRTRVAAAVEDASGLPLHVLSHDEEALLTVLGVLDGRPVAEPTLVLDIGGGSSEVVLLEPGADPVVGVIPVGSARLTAQHVEDDPPTEGEVLELRAEAHHLFSSLPTGHPRRGIVVGGSGTNLVRLTTDEGDEDAPDPGLIDTARTARAIEIVMATPSAQLVETYGLRERRIRQMAAGASLIEAALDCYNLQALEASDASLREGVLTARLLAGDGWRASLESLVVGQRGAEPDTGREPRSGEQETP
jgi:exopolyphosphatase/guanosine-5'-triphosphate,3'-diphosphate pyrophosphatase